MASKFFGRQLEYRFYTAACGNKMAVSVTGPRAVNELGGPVIPGTRLYSPSAILADELHGFPNNFNPLAAIYIRVPHIFGFYFLLAN